MKNYLSLLFISILLFRPAFPQTFGIGGGISFIEGPESFKDAPGGLGFSNGYNLGIKLKIDIPSFPLTPIGFLTFYNFTGRIFEVTEKIWSAGIGAEYKIIRGAVSPYLAIEIAYNHYDLEFDTKDLDIGTPEIRMKANVGLAIGIGTELNIMPFAGIDLNMKYHLINWAVQENNEESLKVLSFNLSVLL